VGFASGAWRAENRETGEKAPFTVTDGAGTVRLGDGTDRYFMAD